MYCEQCSDTQNHVMDLHSTATGPVFLVVYLSIAIHAPNFRRFSFADKKGGEDGVGFLKPIEMQGQI